MGIDRILWRIVVGVLTVVGASLAFLYGGSRYPRSFPLPVNLKITVYGSGTTSPDMWPELEKLVDPQTRGDPMSELRWAPKSR